MKAAEKSGFTIIMKTKILLIISLLFSSFVFSQKVTTIGIRAGINSFGIQGEASDNLGSLLGKTDGILKTTNRTGFFAGANTDIPVTNNFSIEPGLYYSLKGYDMTGGIDIPGADFLGVNARAGLETRYIDLPVLLKGNFNGFEVFAGPQVSYLTSANLKTTVGALGVSLLNKDIDATNVFNKWDAAITGGIGYQFTNGLNIMASYDYGLSKVDVNKSINAHNRGFKIGIGVNF